jgi:hypothetical protein
MGEGMTVNRWQIDTDIPIPPPYHARSFGLTATLRALRVGHSFLIDRSRRQSVLFQAKRAGIKVTTRLQPGGRVRVWRTE